MEDIQDLASIRIMVDDFYTRVRKDELLGPVFSSVITGDWQPHLNQMYDFWNAALFGVPGFRGSPFIKHAPLPIGTEHFIRWIKLFNQTIDGHFQGQVAATAKNKAELMSVLFQNKLQYAKGQKKIIF
ncbi:group III truncated hemoglobin [Mucilaginibacter terrenus]|uniref:Group III truncated hemoglobin n=1 Tax=Mucilaginibacter terrenus TaxID=2482727 RepID=A0A3E2NVU6_9SPHI|nr:group III truncated hemoglobin [Mucilaginibacter terrenus]RFZ85135.1 group III truncated hemoglobin [Mucilaginibacter terrenus]